MNILITGTAGYIGGMLVDQYAQREDTQTVVCIDKEEKPEWLEKHKNVLWIQANLATDAWEEQLAVHELDIDKVVHCAWQIRDWYGGRKTVRNWNIEGSRRVFQWVLDHDSVTRMVYFSSIAQFGAEKSNTTDTLFTPESETRLTGYCYADDKYEVDLMLADMFKSVRSSLAITVIKPSTVTGPRGRMAVGKFSLAAALSADANKSAIPKLVQMLLKVMPVIGRWTRQFVHEDDITDVVTAGLYSELPQDINTYIVSPNDVIDGKKMAGLTGKFALPVPARAAQLGFGILWHATRGRIPTAPGVWKFMAYPICVDGSKVTKELGHDYGYSSEQAISQLHGRYGTQREEDKVV